MPADQKDVENLTHLMSNNGVLLRFVDKFDLAVNAGKIDKVLKLLGM